MASVVNGATHATKSFSRAARPPMRGARAFKAMAHSVLNPANRGNVEEKGEKEEDQGNHDDLKVRIKAFKRSLNYKLTLVTLHFFYLYDYN